MRGIGIFGVIFAVFFGLLACTSSADKREQEARREVELAQLVAAYPTLPIAAGARVYSRQCVTCHHADGTGTGKAIPPLRRHAAAVLNAPGGAQYLPQVVLYGVGGPIDADGANYLNQMPSLGALLRNEEVFAALAYVTRAWGNDAAAAAAPQVTLQDVERARSHRQSAAQTRAARPTLVKAESGKQSPGLVPGRT